MTRALTLDYEARSSRQESVAVCARDLFTIALAAILVRVLVAVTASVHYHTPLWDHAAWGDGPSYVAQAKAMCGDSAGMTDFDRRVFPGFPALIALVHTVLRLPFAQAALLIPWVCSGIAAAAGARLFNDRRIGWAMVFLIPHYLTYSAMPMSEAPLLAVTLGGMLLARREQTWAVAAGGVLMGFGGLIRPVACFAVMGFIAYELCRGHRAKSVAVGMISAATVGLGVAVLHWWTGDAFHGVQVYAHDPHAYDGQIFTWPFHSLLATPRRADLPDLRKGKILYIWIHAMLVLTACGVIVRRCYSAWSTRSTIDRLDILCLPWLLANTLFVLCVGSKWGFFAFARFTIPAMPAAFWAFRRVLPRRWWVWALMALPSLVIAIDSVKRMN